MNKDDFNQIVTELLSENKKCQESEAYKNAYVDGVLDFYNIMKKKSEADINECQK